MTQSLGPGSCIKCVNNSNAQELTAGNIYWIKDLTPGVHPAFGPALCTFCGEVAEVHFHLQTVNLAYCPKRFIPHGGDFEEPIYARESLPQRALGPLIEALEDRAVQYQHPLNPLKEVP